MFIRIIVLILYFTVLHITSVNAQNDVINNPVRDEYFKPLPPPTKQQVNKRQKTFSNINQYEGDHSAKWYRKRQAKKSWYIIFDLTYSFFQDVDNLKVNRVVYTDNNTENGALNYTGTIDGKGALGMDFALGYQRKERYRFEVELSAYRAFLTSIKGNNFTDISLDGGNYIESGPEVINGVGDVLTVTPLTFNILINLRTEKKVIPYIGGGAGYAVIGTTREYDLYPVTQYKVGLNYKLSKKININLAYKRVMLGDISYPYTVREENTANPAYNERIYTMEYEQNLDILSMGYQFIF